MDTTGAILCRWRIEIIESNDYASGKAPKKAISFDRKFKNLEAYCVSISNGNKDFCCPDKLYIGVSMNHEIRQKCEKITTIELALFDSEIS